MTEVIRVKTKSRLHRGALIQLPGGEFRRVVREDASVWRDGWHRTYVEVEAAIASAADYVHDAELADDPFAKPAQAEQPAAATQLPRTTHFGNFPLCGRGSTRSRTTQDQNAVTCRDCSKRLAKRELARLAERDRELAIRIGHMGAVSAHDTRLASGKSLKIWRLHVADSCAAEALGPKSTRLALATFTKTSREIKAQRAAQAKS